MASMKDTLGDTPYPHPARAFDGGTYNAERDHDRLNSQLEAVRELMKDGQWRTLTAIAKHVKGAEPAVSARLRDLRKSKHGGHTVAREYVSDGLWRYRLEVHR